MDKIIGHKYHKIDLDGFKVNVGILKRKIYAMSIDFPGRKPKDYDISQGYGFKNGNIHIDLDKKGNVLGIEWIPR